MQELGHCLALRVPCTGLKLAWVIAGNINSFFETVKWKEVGRTARELIEGLGEMLGTAIRTIDKDKIKQAFTEFMTGAGWVGELALDVALAFGTVKAVGTASKNPGIPWVD